MFIKNSESLKMSRKTQWLLRHLIGLRGRVEKLVEVYIHRFTSFVLKRTWNMYIINVIWIYAITTDKIQLSYFLEEN